jgi:tetratricopeptide (TPR) repeat protein
MTLHGALSALLAVALLAAPAAAQTRPKLQPVEDPARLVRMGETVAGRGEYDHALLLFDRALELDPRNAAALKAAGSAALARGNGPRAFGYFAAWATQARDNPEALLGMGAALVLRQEPQEALAILNRALNLKAPLAEVARWEGIALDLLGRPQDAQLSYSHALGSAPDDAGIIQHFALSLAITGDRAAALQLLGKLVDGPDGQSPDIRRSLALVYALSGDLRAASAILDGLPATDRELMTALFVRIPELTDAEKALVAHLGRLPASKLVALEPAPAPVPATEAPAEPTAEAAAAPAAEAVDLAAAPRIWVQLSASEDRDELTAVWARVGANPSLAGQTPRVEKAPRIYRLIVGPFETSGDAEAVVAALTADGIDSVVARTKKGADISGL